MRDPYISPAGNTFEKKPFLEFVEANRRDPIDERKLEISQLMPNLSLKYSIETFLEENPWAFEHTESDSIETIKFI